MVNTIKYRRNLVKADFGIAVDLAKQLDFLFEKGTLDERQLLCETVFKRLSVKEGKIVQLELNPPFHLIAEVERRVRKAYNLVAHTGFEPVISALRGRCPRPLDECATYILAGGEGFEPSLTDSESAVLPLDDPPSDLKL